jgi:2-polyprenyl-6-methoxyphenol hydroxylase-like FAD-dependent oxidoreductase
MNHITEIASAAALMAAAIGGALIVLPRPKPEPLPVVLEVAPKPVARAEPLSDAERIEALQRQLGEIASEHRRLTQEIRALSVREPEENSQQQRTEPRK